MEIRQKCLPIFSLLYNTNNLLCSYDGINISWPRKENKNWLHVDTMRNDMINRCYQGVVNLLPNGPTNGGLCVVDGSHKRLQQYYDNNPGAGLSWGLIDITDPAFTGLPIYKICLQPGQIAIWDSRLIHCAVQPSQGLRLAAYVSMRPKAEATTADLANRIKWYEEGKMTSHNGFGPYCNLSSLHPWIGRTPDNPRPNVIEVAALNQQQCALVGYDDNITNTNGKIINI